MAKSFNYVGAAKASFLLAAMKPVNARLLAGNGSPSSIFKNVRTLFNRGLQSTCDPNNPETVRCFYECVNQNMTTEQCIEHIQATIGENLDCHEIPNLKIVVNNPRPVDVVKDTYWMFGIPTNIFGQVDCDLNDGMIVYPWDWVTDDGTFSIPPVSCVGLNVNDCCGKVLQTMEDEGIPLVDAKGNCFSCWPHQEPLEPVIDPDTGAVAYLEHSSSDGVTCEASNLTPFDVQSADAISNDALAQAVADLDALLAVDGPISCDEYRQLYEDLLLHARAVPSAMSRITGLLCGFECAPGGTFLITEELRVLLLWIRTKIVENPIKSDENCIIIYTDRQGLVLEPPKIGGSRTNMDYDRDDPDCDEDGTNGGTPVGEPAPAVAPVPAPTTSTTAPVPATTAPVKATAAPVPATTAPVKATAAPVKATAAPVKATASPVKATAAPVKATAAPVKATPAPVKATPAPVKATPAPVKATPAPVRATPAPVPAPTAPLCNGLNEQLSADGKSCLCKDQTVRNPKTGKCEACQAGTQYDWNSKSCICQSNLIPSPSGDGTCVPCPSGTQYDWNSKSCKCQSNKVPSPSGDGTCVDCANGSQFDWNTQSCQCPWGQIYSSADKCEPCQSPLTYDAATKTCKCTQWGYVEQQDGSCTQCKDPWSFQDSPRMCVCTKYGYSLNAKGECVSSAPAPVPAPVPAPTSPVPAPTSPVPAPTSPVPAPTSPVPGPTSTGPAGTCDCTLPAFLDNFALITEGDANVAPKTVYKGIAIGGTLSKSDTSYTSVMSSNYNTKSFVFKEASSNLNINYNGQGVQRGATLADAGVDFEKLKCIARSAKPLGDQRTQNNYNVFVLTKGGTYNLYNFINEGQGEDNGKTLVIFNTTEDITLTNAGGRQFGPSVLAPFSKVTVSNSGFIDGWIVAKTFASTTSSDQMHADAYKGTIACA